MTDKYPNNLLSFIFATSSLDRKGFVVRSGNCRQW